MTKLQRKFMSLRFVVAAALVEHLEPLAVEDIFDSVLQARARDFVANLPKPGHWSWRSEQVPTQQVCDVLGLPVMCVVGEWVYEIPVVTAS